MSAENLLEGFLSQNLGDGELNAEYLLCPELEDVPVTVESYDLKMGSYIAKKGKHEGEEMPWANLQLHFAVDSQEAREEMKRDDVFVYGKPLFLTLGQDLTLDMDNNQGLSRTLRTFGIDHKNMNIKEIFESLVGCYGMGKITHRALSDKEGNPLLDESGEQRYNAEVSALGKA